MPVGASNIYELFSLADELRTRFLVRTGVDRPAGDGDHTIAVEMADIRVQGLHRIEFRDARAQPCESTLEISQRQIGMLPPIGKQKLRPSPALAAA